MECPGFIKDLIAPNAFSLYGYIVAVIYVAIGIIFIATTLTQRTIETGNFRCDIDNKIATGVTSQNFVQTSCFSEYDEKFNSPVRFSRFVGLSFGVAVVMCVIHALVVRFVRERSPSNEEGRSSHDDSLNRPRTFRIFRWYILQLVVRFLWMTLSGVWLYLQNFSSEFSCTALPKSKSSVATNNTSVECHNPMGSEKTSTAKALWITNAFFALLVLIEVFYLARKACHSNNLIYDPEFYQKYFFNKSGDHQPNNSDSIPLQTRGQDEDSAGGAHDIYATAVSAGQSGPSQRSQTINNLIHSIRTYAQNVIARCRDFDINIAKMNLDKDGKVIPLENIYVDLLISEKRENYKLNYSLYKLNYSLEREKIYQQYTEYPPSGILIHNAQEIFSAIEGDNDGKQPRTILVVGQPGIGKSVLCQKLMFDWARENVPSSSDLPDTVTIRLKFRSLDNSRLFNIKELLAEGTYLPPDDPIHEYVMRNPQKLRLIFDGLDEMKVEVGWKKEAEEAKDSQETRMAIFSLFHKLVKGTILNGAMILTTTRQTAEDIYSMLSFDRRVEIIGFTPEKAEKYVEQFCKAKSVDDKRDTVWSYIRESPLLLHLCYIPVNCFIVCLTLIMSIGSTVASLQLSGTITLTHLYQRAVRFIVSEHHPGHKDNEKKANYLQNDTSDQSTKKTLEELEKLAYNGITANQLVFDKLHENDSVSQDMANFGLLNQLPTRNEKYQYCFLHLTVQEFLSAKHIIGMGSSEDIKNFILTNAASGKWHVVIQFLYGLLREKMNTYEIREHILSVINRHMSTGTTPAAQKQRSMVALFMFKCLYELQNNEILVKIVDVVKREISEGSVIYFVDLGITSVDMISIVYCLKHVRGELQCILTELNLSGNEITDGGVELLCNALKSEMSYLRSLNLSRNNITHKGVRVICNALKSQPCNLQTLILRFVRLGGGSEQEPEELLTVLTELTNAVKNEHCKLTNLDLSGNDIVDAGLNVLCDALNNENCKLTDMYLSNNKITDAGIKVLSNTLNSEQCKLTNLYLRSNNITVEGLETLCNALNSKQCKLTNLYLRSNKITIEGLEVLCYGLNNDQCKLTDLDLGNNNVTDAGVKVLCKALNSEQCKLTTLDLSDNHITVEGLAVLCDALTNEQCKLTNLDLSNNNMVDVGVHLLCDALNNEQCKLTDLKFRGNSLTTGSRQELKNALNFNRRRQTQLGSLVRS